MYKSLVSDHPVQVTTYKPTTNYLIHGKNR